MEHIRDKISQIRHQTRIPEASINGLQDIAAKQPATHEPPSHERPGFNPPAPLYQQNAGSFQNVAPQQHGPSIFQPQDIHQSRDYQPNRNHGFGQMQSNQQYDNDRRMKPNEDHHHHHQKYDDRQDDRRHRYMNSDHERQLNSRQYATEDKRAFRDSRVDDGGRSKYDRITKDAPEFYDGYKLKRNSKLANSFWKQQKQNKKKIQWSDDDDDTSDEETYDDDASVSSQNSSTHESSTSSSRDNLKNRSKRHRKSIKGRSKNKQGRWADRKKSSSKKHHDHRKSSSKKHRNDDDDNGILANLKNGNLLYIIVPVVISVFVAIFAWMFKSKKDKNHDEKKNGSNGDERYSNRQQQALPQPSPRYEEHHASAPFVTKQSQTSQANVMSNQNEIYY